MQSLRTKCFGSPEAKSILHRREIRWASTWWRTTGPESNVQISRFEHWIWIAIEQEIIYQTFDKKSSLLKSLVTNCLKTQWTVNNLVRILNPISFKAWIHHIKVQKLQCTLVNFVAFKVWFFAGWFIQPKSSRFIFHAAFCQRFSNEMMWKKQHEELRFK